MAKTATSATPVGITKHLPVPPQSETLIPDAEMQARVEQLTAAHGIQVVELEGPFDGLYGHSLQLKDGTRLVVPAGQDPSTRLWAARALLTHQGVMPV